LAQQQEEDEELQLLIQNSQRKRIHQPLQQPNQHIPAQRLKEQHKYISDRLQLEKLRMHLSLITVVSCAVGYILVYFWISVAMPAGSMSSYASSFGGGFPPDFGAQLGALAFFGLLCIFLLDRINPDIARKISEERHRTYP
jgi:hypothetical protein